MSKYNITLRNDVLKGLLCLCALLMLFHFDHGITFAQEVEILTIKNLRQHIDFIASDDTEGRFTGSTGYKKAANYVARVFHEAGLNPICTDEKGGKSYLQPVPFIRNNYGPATSILIRKNGRDKTFGHSAETFAILNPGMKYHSIPIASPVFVGYGIHEPTHGWDDYAGVDVKGKWVILLDGIPPRNQNQPKFPNRLRRRYANSYELNKYKAVNKHQVAGAMSIHNENSAETWEMSVIRKYRFNYLRYAESNTNRDIQPEPAFPSLLIHPEIAQILMAGQSFDPVANKGTYHSFVLGNTEISVTIDRNQELIHCYNVIGIVPGTDPALEKKVLSIGAHLDHLGRIGDNIYNGANDDVSGCVIMLESAKAIAKDPPKRPVLFAAFTGEEVGLIGSRHFVNHPPIPLDYILLNINIEQVGSRNRTFPGVWAIGSKRFKNSFYKSGDIFNKSELKYDSINEMAEYIYSTDTESFYRKKIPSVILGSGGFTERHTPQDEIALIDFEHLYKAAQLLNKFIMELANQ